MPAAGPGATGSQILPSPARAGLAPHQHRRGGGGGL